MVSSSEFVALVKKLQQYPNDTLLKKEVASLLPRMLSLSKSNSFLLYLITAHAYAPNSPQYQQNMRQAANMGCTNAMLVMCQILGKSNNPQDLKKAALYLAKIDHSNDSYVKEEADKLISEYPLLAQAQAQTQAQAQKQGKPSLEHKRACRFFMPQQRIKANSEHSSMQNVRKP